MSKHVRSIDTTTADISFKEFKLKMLNSGWKVSTVKPKNLFFRVDDVWHLRYLDEEGWFPNLQGFQLIQTLLRLVENRNFERIDYHRLLESIGGGNPDFQKQDAIPKIDKKAIYAVQDKLNELKQELSFENNNRESVERQIEQCQKYLDENSFLDRPSFDSINKKNRDAVMKNINSAKDQIEKTMPKLSKHLKEAIRPNNGISYNYHQAVRWSFQ
jgi:hypothetical protein